MNDCDITSEDTDELVRLSFFVEMGKAIAGARTMDETLTRIMEHIGAVFRPEHWSVLLKDPDTGELTFALVIGTNAAKLQGMRLPPGEGVAGWVVERGLPLIVEDVSADRRFSKRIDQLTGFETKSIIGVPLMTDRKVFGVIELINKLEGGKFTSLELRILTAVADFAAIALEKAYCHRALRKMAETDPLTGVYNRRAFKRLFLEQIEICEQSCRPFSVLMIDIDQFEKIVDVHGRAAGDELLKRLAGLLESSVRRTDMVFRFGGDEFVVMLPGALRGQAGKVRARIVERIGRLLGADQGPAFSVSVGLHTMESGEDSELVKLLDSDLRGEMRGKFSSDPGDIFVNFHEMLRDERSLRPPRQERFGR